MPTTAPLLSRLSPFVRLSHDFSTRAFSLPPRRINDHGLLYFKLGGGTFVHGDDSYDILPGSLFLVRPIVEHRFDARGAPFHMLNMHVDLVERPDSTEIDLHQSPGHVRPPLPQDVLDDGDAGIPVLTRIRQQAVYERLFGRVHGLFQLNDPASRLQIKAAMLDLLAFVYREAHQQRIAPSLRAQVPRLEAAVSYMQSHYREPITHDQAASKARMSRSYFARCFKEYYRVSPLKFLTQLRMEKAKTELTLTQVPIKIIAENVGYSTVHHFTRAFTQTVGVSPAAYRKMHG